MNNDMYEYFYKDDKVILLNILVETRYLELMEHILGMSGMKPESLNYSISSWAEDFVKKSKDNFYQNEIQMTEDKSELKSVEISQLLLDELKKLKEFNGLNNNEVIEMIISLEMNIRERDPNFLIL